MKLSLWTALRQQLDRSGTDSRLARPVQVLCNPIAARRSIGSELRTSIWSRFVGVAAVRRPWLETGTRQPRFQLGNWQPLVYRHNGRQPSTRRTPGQAVRQRLDGGRMDARLTKPMQISLRFDCCPRSEEVRPAGELQTEHRSKLSSGRPFDAKFTPPNAVCDADRCRQRTLHPVCDQLAQATCSPRHYRRSCDILRQAGMSADSLI